MSDQFTEVTTQGWGSRLGGSIMGVLFGLILLPASFVLLYWNEGRAVEAAQALSRGASEVIEISPATADPGLDGKLVHVTGMMMPGTSADDPAFGIAGKNLLRLKRHVEMYAWVEDKSTESHESMGGSKTTETTYSYKKAWTTSPKNSSAFRHPDGHQNPQMAVQSETRNATGVTLGAYKVAPAVIYQLDSFQPVPAGAPPEGYQADGDNLYRGHDPSNPALGDLRVSFSSIEAQPVSLVDGVKGGTLEPFTGLHDYTINLASPGDVSAADMFRAKAKAESIFTWILRGVGFFLMLVAFLLIAGPVSMVLAFLPFLEGIAQVGAFLVAITLSIPLTLFIIALAWIAHRPVLGIGLMVAAMAAFVLFRMMHKRPVAARVAA